MKKLCAVAVLSLLLAGCDQVDQVSGAADKASACSQALGIAGFDPTVDPAELQAQAQDKASQLRDLGNKVADQDLKQNLFTLADSYVELEQRKADQLGNLNDWIQRNLANLDQLRKTCL